MTLGPLPVPPALSPWVEFAWSLEGTAAPLEAILPDGRCELVFHFGALPHRDGALQSPAFLVGPLTTPVHLESTGPLSTIGVRLSPAAAGTFLRLPAHELEGRFVDLDFLKPAEPTWNAIVNALLAHARHCALPDPALPDPALTLAVGLFLASHGTARIDDVALPAVKFVHRHSRRETFQANPAADGSFAIPNFPAGPFTVETNTPPGLYVQSIFQEAKAVADSNADGGPIDIIFNSATARLTGTVQPPPGDQPFRAGIVYLIPEGRWLGAGPNPERNQAIVNLDLAFPLTDIAPGRYLVFVSEGMLPNGVSAEILRSLGTSVQTLTISPNSRQKIVLPLIQMERMVAAGVEFSF